MFCEWMKSLWYKLPWAPRWVDGSEVFGPVEVCHPPPEPEEAKKKRKVSTAPFAVLVDDNYHYMDEEARYMSGEFSTWEEAVVKAKKIVDESIAAAVNDGLSAEDALDNYRMFGEDPWITGNGPVPDGETFSAWSYAEERCKELCRVKTAESKKG